MSMPPSNEASPAPAHSVNDAKIVLWSIQTLAGIPDDIPSSEIESAASPPGNNPIVMLRTITFDDGPAMWIPKLADDPLAPLIVMLFFFLISTICAGFCHCAHTSV